MAKYRFSVIRFVPSPVRGEQLNLGLIVGSDQTGEWSIRTMENIDRLRKLDDYDVLPDVTAELTRLKLSFPEENGSEIGFSRGKIINEEWMRSIARNSQNVIQFSFPRVVVAEDVVSAMDSLWEQLIFEPAKVKRTSVTRQQIISRYTELLKREYIGDEYIKRYMRLKTSRTEAQVDIAVHNGIVKEITQCLSFQVKEKTRIINDTKAWGWTIRDMRQSGGQLTGHGEEIHVPSDVKVSVVYVADDSEEGQIVQSESFQVFEDSEVQATAVPLDRIHEYLEESSQSSWPELLRKKTEIRDRNPI